ncbi:MAG: PrsW family glutamic-type intramembrane protease [Gaiellaceae bacterium]
MIALLNDPGFYITYALIQALVILVAIRFLDLYERQPFWLLALLAGWGATGAAAISLAGNNAVRGMLSADTREVFGNAIAPPLVEECAKGLALLAAIWPLRWIGRRLGVSLFDGLSDGIVCGAAVGLGFGFTEDFFYFLDAARVGGLQTATDVFTYRRDFFGPAVLHHPVFSACFGAGLGMATWSVSRMGKVLFPLAGLALGVLFHAVNNGFVYLVLYLKYGLAAAAAYVRDPASAVPAVAETADTFNRLLHLLDFWLVALFVGAMVLWQRFQRRIIRQELTEEVGLGLLTRAEWDEMFRYPQRLRRYWRLVRAGELERYRQLRTMHGQLVRLALLKWRTRRMGGDWNHVQRLRREIAALGAVDVAPSNLPTPATPLVGRETELGEVEELLRDGDVRAVTLTGAGGTGKTRLALEAASRLRDDFGGGLYLAELAPLRDASLVVRAVAEALGVTERPGEPLLRTVTEFLRDKQALLVLDNFEQVIDAAPQVAELLGAARHVKVLATSRQPLRIIGETEYPLSPLAVPAAAGARDAATIAASPAVALFVERAKAVDPSFRLDPGNAADVLEICRSVDGLPLAIELAAARVKLLPPKQILERLAEPLELLTSGARDLPERHRTLRAAIDWSYGLLDGEEQLAFSRLAVFAGGFTLEAAEQVAGSGLEVLGSLVDMSLVRRGPAREGEPRFVLLETIREYAEGRLAERGELDERRRLHAGYFAALAEQAEPALTGPAQSEWLVRLTDETDNIRAALDWSVEAREFETLLRIAGALVRFWSMRGYLTEGRRRLQAALAAGTGMPAPMLAKGHYAAGYSALGQADYDEAVWYFEQSLELARAVGDRRREAAALAQLAWIAMEQGEADQAARLAKDGLAMARELGDPLTESGVLNTLAELAAASGDDAEATALLQQGLALRRALGDRRLVANSLLELGRAELTRPRLDEASELFQEAESIARELGDTWSLSLALGGLGRVELGRGRLEEASVLLTEALRVAGERGDVRAIADSLQALGAVQAARGQAEVAAQLVASAGALRESIDAIATPAEQATEAGVSAQLRGELGDRFEGVWERGRRLSAAEALVLAFAPPADRAPAPAPLPAAGT